LRTRTPQRHRPLTSPCGADRTVIGMFRDKRVRRTRHFSLVRAAIFRRRVISTATVRRILRSIAPTPALTRALGGYIFRTVRATPQRNTETIQIRPSKPITTATARPTSLFTDHLTRPFTFSAAQQARSRRLSAIPATYRPRPITTATAELTSRPIVQATNIFITFPLRPVRQ
jgi:hypothetical protein